MAEVRVDDVLELGRLLIGLDVDGDAVVRLAGDDVQLEVRVGGRCELVVDGAATQNTVVA